MLSALVASLLSIPSVTPFYLRQTIVAVLSSARLRKMTWRSRTFRVGMILHALALQLSPTLVHIECVNRSNDIECSGFMICDKYVFEMICPLVVKMQAVLLAVELSLFMF